MLASGLTLILSMMGVLNFAHASIYMLGAYFAYQISHWVGFWPAFVLAPLLCGADRRGDRGVGAAARATTTAISPNCCSPSAWCSSSAAPCRWRGACCRCRIGCRPARFSAVLRLRRELPGVSRLHAAGIGRHAVHHLAAAEEDAHRPDHPGRAHASRHGQRAWSQRAARVHHRVCRRIAARRARRGDRRQLLHRPNRAWPMRWDRSCLSW